MMCSHSARPVRAFVLGASALLVVFTVACREQAALVTGGALAPQSVSPRVRIVTSGTSAALTLALDVPPALGKIRSYTGRVLFDSTALRFEAETALGDGAMRAFNPQGGVLRVAGASLTGIDVNQLAAFRFTVINAKGLETVRLELDELHEFSKTDLMPSVRRAAAGAAVRP